MASHGFFRTALSAFVEARQRQARREIDRYIQTLGEEALKAYTPGASRGSTAGK
jgi:hypothetical protein